MRYLRPSAWTMRTRIAAALALVALVMLPVNLLAVGSYRRLLAQVGALADVEAAQLRAVNEIGAHLARVRSGRRMFFRTATDGDLDSAMGHLKDATDQCRLALRLSDRERSAFARVARLLVRYRQALEASAPLVRDLRGNEAERAEVIAHLESLETLVDAVPRPSGPDPGRDAVSRVLESLVRLEAELQPMGRVGSELAAQGQLMEELAAAAEEGLDDIADRTWSALAAGRVRAGSAAAASLRNLVTALLITVPVVIVLSLWLPSVATRPLLRLRSLVRRVEQEEVDRMSPGDFPPGESRRLAEALAATLDRGRDIQRLQKQRIRQLENRFRRLLDGVAQPVLVVGREGRVAACGKRAAELLGQPARTIEGRNLEDLLPGAEIPDLLERLAASHEEGAARIGAELLGAAGKKIEARIEPLRDEAGDLRQALVYLQLPEGSPTAGSIT